MITYIVYEQRTPIPNGRKINKFGEYDRRGEYEDCDANLVALGHVVTYTHAKAWDVAKTMTKHPVMEEIKQ